MRGPIRIRLGADRLAHQLCQVAIVFVGKVRFRHDGDLWVADPQEEFERVIVAAIEKHARGDVSLGAGSSPTAVRASGWRVI